MGQLKGSGLSFTELSKKASEDWKQLSDADKTKWTNLAKQAKKEGGGNTIN